MFDVKVGRNNSYEIEVLDAEGEATGLGVAIKQPLQKRSYWRDNAYEPEREDPQYSTIAMTSGYGGVTAADALELAEALKVAADISVTLNKQAWPQLEQQAKQRTEFLAKKQAEEQVKQQRRSKLREELQWYIGQNFKLKREGFRATVFGKIDRFSDTHIYTTSERGVPMDTRIDDVYFFAIKYEGEKRYTTIFEREPVRRA